MTSIHGGTPFGRGDARIDVARAVLLDTINVVMVGTATWGEGAGRAIGLELAGRINKAQARTSVLYLMDEDGAAAIVSELVALAGRAGAGQQFLDLMMQRLQDMPRNEGGEP